MKKLVLALSLTFLSATHAQANDKLVEIRGDKPVTIRADRAYFLFRSNAGVSPVFLRVPSDAEVQAYETARREAFAKAEPGLIEKRKSAITREKAIQGTSEAGSPAIPPVPSLENFNFVYDQISNAQTVNMGRTLTNVSNEKVMLIEAMPGDYVIYGVGVNQFIHTCLCLGTVSFSVESGQIVDLGTILIGAASQKSDLPELNDETGFGPSLNGHVVAWAVAIRPAAASSSVPSPLSSHAVTPAAYRATGKFVSFAFTVNRLAPLSGVLGYDKGDVLDLVNNTVASNQY